jgi:MoaA/NifB/PqqE/SkfB family radical SAM enzyme
VRYDIEADWQLLNTCNYRCDYCFFPPSVLGSPLPRFRDPAAWRRAFDKTRLTWLLHVTGGEPTVHPGFAELCATLTKKHYLSLNTNLSHASIYDFAERVNPARVSFINAGFHYDERMRRSGAEKFVRHLSHLTEHGFPIFVSVVATPRALERMEEIVELLAPTGTHPVPKLLRGMHEGKHFPADYTPVDHERFKLHARFAREFYAPLLASMPEAPSIDPFGDDALLGGVPSYAGRNCEAGRRFVAIKPDGAVMRCSDQTPLGNLLQGTFARRLQATPCDTNYCYYFCKKHTKPAQGRTSWFNRIWQAA